MDGYCRHCNLPWYSAAESSQPIRCYGCGLPAEQSNSPLTRPFTAEPKWLFRGPSIPSARTSVILGVALVSVSAIWSLEIVRFTQDAKNVAGVVVSEDKVRTKHGIKTYQTVSYQAGGKKQSVRISDETLKPGNSVQLMVSSSDPTDARDPDALWDNKIFLILVGGVISFLGLLFQPKN